MSEARLERRLAAILLADVVGYSRLMGADEEATLKGIRAEVIDAALAQYRGRVVGTRGDGVLAEFPSVVDAVRCASDIQAQMADRNAALSPGRRIEFRIGINVGEIVAEDGDILCDGVNVAARLEDIAEPGGICVSARVQEDAAGKVKVHFEDLGPRQLKNIARPVQAYRVHLAPVKGRTSSPPVPLAIPNKPSIAVLAFANMSNDPEQEFFADGLAQDIITLLSKSRALFVIARNSSFTYKHRTAKVKDIGLELGVRFVLEGSVREAGTRVRVTTQLVEAATNGDLWAERYDRDLADIFSVQDEITQNVCGAIQPALEHGERERVSRRPPESLGAWESYHRGMWHFAKYEEPELRLARSFFERAVALNTEVLVAAIHRAVVGTVHQLLEFEIFGDTYTMGELEEKSRHAIARASAIYAIIMNWSERDEAGRNPALAAVLEEMKFEGERNPILGWEIPL